MIMFKYKTHMELKVTLKFPPSNVHMWPQKNKAQFLICIFNKFAILEWFQAYGKFAKPVKSFIPYIPDIIFPILKY